MKELREKICFQDDKNQLNNHINGNLTTNHAQLTILQCDPVSNQTRKSDLMTILHITKNVLLNYRSVLSFV